jgi:2'-5' RNA ligase
VSYGAMTTATTTDAGTVQERRGGLIVPVPEAEATLRPSNGEYLPVWSDGMPAHVTLLFPFFRLDQLDADSLATLKTMFAAAPSIRATFSEVGHFPEVVYLAPEPRDWFVRLTEALSARFGLLPYGGIHSSIVPHLTVANRVLDAAEQARIAGLVKGHLPIATDVREVWLMEEAADGHWERAATFALRE